MDIQIQDILSGYKDRLSNAEHNNIILEAQVSAANKTIEEKDAEIEELKASLTELKKSDEKVSE